MRSIFKSPKTLLGICIILILAFMVGCNSASVNRSDENHGSKEIASEGELDRDRIQDGKMGEEPGKANGGIEKGKSYSSMEEVAEYIHEFGILPPNYITKSEAVDAGWDKSAGDLWEVTDKASIGGDYFGNREGLLPDANGRKYYECDINYSGGYRGAERIVFSNDGLIFYTSDHYESFKQLY